MQASEFKFTIGPGIKMIFFMGWTCLVLFGGWYAHAKYGASNELFILKGDNAAIKKIREEKQNAERELALEKAKNGKFKHDCADVTFSELSGQLQLHESD